MLGVLLLFADGEEYMKLLAMDLSLSCPAFAVVEVLDGVIEIHHLSHLRTKAGKTHGYRLFEIYNRMVDIYIQFPDIQEVVRERGFSKFPSTTQALFKVVGTSDICAYKHGFPTVHEITPLEVKKLVTGNGKSDKDKVAKALKTVYGIENKFKTDDESDAVAVAIAYFIKKKLLV